MPHGASQPTRLRSRSRSRRAAATTALAGCLLALAVPRAASAHRAPAEALARADSALAVDPGSARLHLERAELLRRSGRPDAAEAAYLQALTIDPSLAVARTGLAGALLDSGHAREALTALGPAADRPAPSDRILRARILAAAGRPREAAREFDAALAALPAPPPDLFLARADVATTPADAIRVLDEGIARLGGSAALAMRAAELEIARGDAAAAQRRIDRLERGGSGIRGAGAGAGDAFVTDPGDAPAASSAGTPVVVRGPYLQNATPHSIVVRWRTETPTTSRVVIQTSGVPVADERDVASSFERLAISDEHALTIFGLQPETRYEYAIGAVNSMLVSGDSTYSFVTPPLPGPARPMRIWVLGDCGTGNSDAAAVRDAYLAYPGADETSFWLMLGDNAYSSGSDLEYQAGVFDMYPTFLHSFPLWLTRGNHDELYPGTFNDYYELFTLPTLGEAGGVPSGTEAYYSFDWANVHLICLDSMDSDRAVTGAMHLWLEEDLAATTADWVIAFWHHPPYSKGSHDSDNAGDGGGRMVDMRENFLPLLESAGVDLLLAGHSHDYERSFLLDGHYGFSSTFGPQFVVDGGDGRPDGDGAYAKPTLGPASHEGAVYVVAGNSGKVDLTAPLNHPAMFLSLADLGSLLIDIDGDRLDAVHLDSTGAEADRFAIVKGAGYVGSPVAEDARTGPELAAAGTPFRETVRFDFSVPRRGRGTLTVFDLHGRRVARLRDGVFAPGAHSATWDGRDAEGHVVASGVYFAVLSFEGQRRVRHVVKAR